MPAVLQTDISMQDEDWRALVADIDGLCRTAAEAAHTAAGAGTAELSLVLADDAFVQDLNKRYRGIDGPTNVLSFPAADPDTPGESLLGDVILARETVIGEAQRDDKPLADHLSHLVIHGTLHLLGYDHENSDEAAEMEALETRILADLSIPDPYAEQPPESDR